MAQDGVGGNMSFGIVTGHTGTVHITPVDDKSLNAGICGSENFVLSVGNKFSASLMTSNKVRILDGYGMMGGCQFGFPPGEYQDITIENGAQGYNRIDIIVARYTLIGKIESVSLVVIKGTPTTGTPSMPNYNKGSVIAGTTTDFVLYMVKLTGLSPTITTMFDILIPAKEAWDSISRTFVDGWTVQKIGGITRYSKAVSKSFTFGAAGAVFASGTITEYFPGKVGAILGVSVSLCDAARDGWVGCTDAGSEGVNFKFFSWFNVGSPAARRFSICVDVTS